MLIGRLEMNEATKKMLLEVATELGTFIKTVPVIMAKSFKRKLKGKAKYRAVAEKIFKEYHLPKGLASVMLEYESRTGDLMVSPTGCLGWYQFCRRTAKAYNLKNPMDLVESSHAAAKLALANKRYLKSKQVKIDSLSLYLAHMLGMGGSTYLYTILRNGQITSSQEKTLRNVMSHNWNNKGMGKPSTSIHRDANAFYAHVSVRFEELNRFA